MDEFLNWHGFYIEEYEPKFCGVCRALATKKIVAKYIVREFSEDIKVIEEYNWYCDEHINDALAEMNSDPRNIKLIISQYKEDNGITK